MHKNNTQPDDNKHGIPIPSGRKPAMTHIYIQIHR
jgi:hypothetical protein